MIKTANIQRMTENYKYESKVTKETCATKNDVNAKN
jgi:hypothetical protein